MLFVRKFCPMRALHTCAVLASLSGTQACVDNLTHPEPLLAYTAATTGPSCVPNLDGVIDASELQPAFGVPAGYRISPAGATRVIDSTGQIDAAGHRVWDWSQSVAGDQLAHIAAEKLGNQWYAAEFAQGQFVVPFDPAGNTDAIYRQDDKGLYLLGLASHNPAPPEGKTLLPYAQPVLTLQLPLQVGAKWVAVGKTAAGKGVLHGLPFASVDTYSVSVDASGRLELPDITLTQALRVRTLVQVVPVAGITTTRRQVSYLFECLGEVARASSQNNEISDDFTAASEVRRLAL